MADPTPAECHSPAAATHQIAARLADVLGTRVPADGRMVRIELRIADIEPLAWLQAQSDFTQYYWSSRDEAFEMAGVGEADVLVPLGNVDYAGLFDHMRSRLAMRYPSLRYYGGFRFQAAGKGERWRAFKAYRFVVPRFEVVKRLGGTFLACNVKPGNPRGNAERLEQVLADLSRLSFTPAPAAPPPKVIARADLPDEAGWHALVERALDDFSAHRIEKVVLARETCFEADGPWDAARLLGRLVKQSQRSFEFCFHPAPGRAFIGASPERLYHRVNCYVQSEAIAGTRPRGKSDEADTRLADALLHSEKDLREHRFVVRMLRENLGRFCRQLQVEPEPDVLRLRHCQHLYTRMEGILKQNDVDAALIEALHPTPAVGGAPRDRALDWIAREEPFDRGCYAAPVGWVGFDAAEFCVAIRSGLVQGNTLSLYNGAGIVPGSLPAEEWDEVENKMAGFLAALTRHDG
jgi:menaquinone-specific isochorismate synthase